MPEICPKIAQDISKICLRYAQALPKVWGFILRKWDKMSPGRVHQLGQYVSGEVHNAVGQFVLGTKCLLTIFFFRFLLDPEVCKWNFTFLFPNSKKSFPLTPALTKSCAHMTDGQLRWRCIWRLKAFYILPQTVKLSVNTRLTTRWLVDKKVQRFDCQENVSTMSVLASLEISMATLHA